MVQGVTFKIRGLKEVEKFFHVLPTKLNKKLSKGNLDFLKKVRKSAKLRAPRFKGKLAKDIQIDKTKSKGKNKQYMLYVNSFYAYQQETGEGLPRYVPIQSLKNKGWLKTSQSGNIIGTNSKTRGSLRKSGGLTPKKGYVIVRHYKPFVGPAFNKEIGKYDNKLNQLIDEALR